MDRRLARRNFQSGLVIGGLAVFFFGLAFVFAGLYIA